MGRTSSVDDHAIHTRLAAVFRTSGYAGASLSALSEAVGLQRASLYHRFPDGKPGMATAVLTSLEADLAATLEPLVSEPDVAAGVAEMARRLAIGYRDGRMSCVLDTMTLMGAPDDIKAHAARLARTWLQAMTAAAVRAGATESDAAGRARAALVRIEGALVVARVLDDPSVFAQTLAELPDLLGA
ncbi:TetR/AcrR family transcriptional regulator [Winogradskya consettensis]|uniref:TetR family transcriptional regulator n=1 Tax=Winogradskya consettensis TaxID=113560 RepID=A0A919T0I2_9ACTN|nr:TetR family transcriptional regulator [Actinoplanes consettensis]GIM80603.1 TetR family transcriptional regulator [Actinoplanes consettensis]